MNKIHFTVVLEGIHSKSNQRRRRRDNTKVQQRTQLEDMEENSKKVDLCLLSTKT